MNNDQTIGRLLLMRHGKAEPREAARDDFHRQLTPKGIGELEKMLPLLREYVKLEPQVYIWSSPLLRATQTAEIIAAGLDINDLQQFEWIAGGRIADLEQELHKLSAPYCVILIGHEPELSSWSMQISGYTQAYEKGMGIKYDVLSLETLRARPMGLLQPKAIRLEELNLNIHRKAISEFKKLLRYNLQEIFNMLQWFQESPHDQDATHQLRVRIRSLRSFLSFMKPLLNLEEYITIQNQLRELAQGIAHLREIDVLSEDWERFVEDRPSLSLQESEFLHMLKIQRTEEEARVYSQMITGKPSQALFLIFQWLQGLENKVNPEHENSYLEMEFKDYVRHQLRNWSEKLTKQFSRTDFSDLEQIHALRIRYKKLRYVVTLLETYLPVNRDCIAEFKDMQESLGIICDAQRNLTVVSALNKKYGNLDMNYESGIFVGYQLCQADDLIRKIIRNTTCSTLK